ncbi:MAG: leucine-rich repeat domain-containing protein [Oscillospiraceae bacterium]|nr:leucine-rich repeat domain-containing protein [Oscillospiraceae bacterium]
MRKRFLSFVLVLVLLVSMFPAMTASAVTTGSCGTNATYTIDDNGVLTISGTGTINDSAFNSNTSLKGVVIGEGITSIGSKAFYRCTGVKFVTFPSTLEGIGASAFEFCNGLRALSIPSSVKSIGSKAFYNCGRYGLYLTIEANRDLEIGNSAFYSSTTSYVNFAGTTPPTLGTSTFHSRFTVYLSTGYNNGVATEFGSATVQTVAAADAEASVTFSNGVVIYYETLRKAFYAASGSFGSKVTLLHDIEEMSDSASLYGPADVTFDLNGKNITINRNRYISVGGVAGAKLTMTGTGKITYNYDATEVPTGSSVSLYAPVKIYSSQNEIGFSELVIGGNVTIEATDDLTAAVAVGANDPPAPVRLTVKENAKLISNNASYIISYDSPLSANRWGNCDIVLEGGSFENKAGGNVIGYDDTPYDNPDALYHVYLGVDDIQVDSKLKNVYYLVSHNLPTTLGSVSYSENAVEQNGKFYVKDGEIASLSVSRVPSEVTLSATLNGTPLVADAGVYSFAVSGAPARVLFELAVVTHTLTVDLGGGELTQAALDEMAEYDIVNENGILTGELPENLEIMLKLSDRATYVIKPGYKFIGFSDENGTLYTEDTKVIITKDASYELLWEPYDITLATVEGAQMRLSDPQGLRFTSTIAKRGDFDKVKEYGTVLIPTENLTNLEDLKIGAELGGRTVVKVPAVYKYAEDDESVTFTAVVTHIAEKNYNRAYTARAYAIMEDDSVIYAETSSSRSIYEIASVILESDTASEAEKEAAQVIVNVVETD